MNLVDLLVVVVIVTIAVAGIAAGEIIILRDEVARQRKRAEVAELWAEEYQRQACEFQQRLMSLERQRDNLRMLYASLVRERLAASAPIVEYYARRKAK